MSERFDHVDENYEGEVWQSTVDSRLIPKAMVNYGASGLRRRRSGREQSFNGGVSS